VAATLNWNLFNGFRDKAQIEEAHRQLLRAKATRERSASAVRLEVRRTWEELRPGGHRVALSEASVARMANVNSAWPRIVTPK